MNKASPDTDPRGKKDVYYILTGKDLSNQNEMGIENALSLKDLDMALFYVLDQVANLEMFIISIILYFNGKQAEKPQQENFFDYF